MFHNQIFLASHTVRRLTHVPDSDLFLAAQPNTKSPTTTKTAGRTRLHATLYPLPFLAITRPQGPSSLSFC